MKKTGINIQQTCWKDIREEFSRVNNPLAEIIDNLDPSKDFTLFVASYPFGEIPLRDGCFQLPDLEENNQELSHLNIFRTIQTELSYNKGAMPVSMVMDNSFEVFLQFNHYTLLPHGLLTKGDLFSTWRVLSDKPHQVPKFTWNLSSGARSIFMLPKIAEKKRHARLKKTFGIQSDTPTQLLDHWQIFKELANSHIFEEQWAGKLIFFGKKWFESLNDSAWIFFKQFLLQSAWNKTAFGRNQFVWDLVYSLIQAKIHLKPDPYIMDTVKYLLSIAAGSMPGFAPVIDDHAGPMKQLKKIYLEQYQIEYAPIIMHPQFLQENKSVYYSLEYPCTMEFSPSTRKKNNKIVLLEQIKNILHKIQKEITDPQLHLSDTSIFEAIDTVAIDFFHSNAETYSGINNSSSLILHDEIMSEICNGLDFPSNAPFMQGCIRLSNKENDV